MRTTWSFHSAGQLLFGREAALQVGEIARRLGAARVFVVSDAHLVKAGIAEQVRSALTTANVVVEVFDGGLPEPPIALAESCAQRAREFQAQAILGLGGGSNMDLAKIVATVL